MPLLKEISETSQDSLCFMIDSKESWDVSLIFFKSGIIDRCPNSSKTEDHDKPFSIVSYGLLFQVILEICI